MSTRTEHTAEAILTRERADKERHKQLAAEVLQSQQCKYVRRGSKGDLLGFRWYFCRMREGHAGPHLDPYNRHFQSDIQVRNILKGQMPCELITEHTRTAWERSSHLRCFRIEGHFGMHRDEYGGRFRSSVLDIDVFTSPGRWPVRTEPFPPVKIGKLE